jgi:hypothetical protein
MHESGPLPSLHEDDLYVIVTALANSHRAGNCVSAEFVAEVDVAIELANKLFFDALSVKQLMAAASLSIAERPVAALAVVRSVIPLSRFRFLWPAPALPAPPCAGTQDC